jgi:hypothetical protein
MLRTAHRLGIASQLEPFLSIGLGGQAVNPLEMARAYSALANGGFRIDGSIDKLRNHPRAILAVGRKTSTNFDCEDRVVACNKPKARRVLRADTVAPRTRSCSGSSPGHGLRAALPGSPSRRQDGHDHGLRRRLVRRLHATARDGGVGRYPHKLIPMTTGSTASRLREARSPR